jgi:hypothetical protein
MVLRDGVRADTFLLDTHEGRVWILTEYTSLDSKPVAWRHMDRLDTLEESVEFYRSWEAVEKAAKEKR